MDYKYEVVTVLKVTLLEPGKNFNAYSYSEDYLDGKGKIDSDKVDYEANFLKAVVEEDRNRREVMISEEYANGYCEAFNDCFTRIINMSVDNHSSKEVKLSILAELTLMITEVMRKKFKDESNEQSQVHTNNDS